MQCQRVCMSYGWQYKGRLGKGRSGLKTLSYCWFSYLSSCRPPCTCRTASRDKPSEIYNWIILNVLTAGFGMTSFSNLLGATGDLTFAFLKHSSINTYFLRIAHV